MSGEELSEVMPAFKTTLFSQGVFGSHIQVCVGKVAHIITNLQIYCHFKLDCRVVVYYYSFHKLKSLVSFKWVSVLGLFSRRYLVFIGLMVDTLSW